MKMRDYYDATHGRGAWDRMHELIAQKIILGWRQPGIEVDGRKVSIFPGEDRECTLEQVQDEIRKVFAQVDRSETTTH
jgi:hypothetical protein